MFPGRNSWELSGDQESFADGSARTLTCRRLDKPFIDIRPKVREENGAGATPVSATVSVIIRSRRCVKWLGRSHALCMRRYPEGYSSWVWVALYQVRFVPHLLKDS